MLRGSDADITPDNHPLSKTKQREQGTRVRAFLSDYQGLRCRFPRAFGGVRSRCSRRVGHHRVADLGSSLEQARKAHVMSLMRVKIEP